MQPNPATAYTGETYCDVCGRRDSWGCGHTSEQRREARAHNESEEHRTGACWHYDHAECDPDTCQYAGNRTPEGEHLHGPGYAPMVKHATRAASPVSVYWNPDFPSKAAEDTYRRRGTYPRRCETVEQAQAEVERLMAGIHGFEGCEVTDVYRREADGCWEATFDDPEDEFEQHVFTIFDDGDMDWN